MCIRDRNETIQDRLEYLRGQIEAQQISYGEISELQELSEHIHPADVQLLEWAGIPEFSQPHPVAEVVHPAFGAAYGAATRDGVTVGYTSLSRQFWCYVAPNGEPLPKTLREKPGDCESALRSSYPEHRGYAAGACVLSRVTLSWPRGKPSSES